MRAIKRPVVPPPAISATSTCSVDAFVGVSAWVKAFRKEILQIAPVPSTVLICGPSGTGKELAARAIHFHSPRAAKPFVAVDCAGVSGPLFAGHLFGHLKGAFTGADQATLGCFRAADKGTIFLDEIGELGRDLQGNLLRVLQERVVTPLGSHATTPVDVRIIAATNRDLEQMVADGLFREDLYYRLRVVTIKTAPLRDHPEDILPLAQNFLKKTAFCLGIPEKELSCHCLDCMQQHEWPGNVRELENFLEHAVVLSSENTIRPDNVSNASNHICICPIGKSNGRQQGRSCGPPSDDIAVSAAPAVAEDTTASDVPWPTLDQQERDHILRTLERTGYNQRRAADLLGVTRQQLQRKVNKHGIDNSASRPGRPKKLPR
jgi:DNA-binding NtrC family response regulator